MPFIKGIPFHCLFIEFCSCHGFEQISEKVIEFMLDLHYEQSDDYLSLSFLPSLIQKNWICICISPVTIMVA